MSGGSVTTHILVQDDTVTTTRRTIVERTPATAADGTLVFAHPSEAEFANILTFYQIDWQYEPRAFAIDWDENDTPISYFTPDFFLPEFGLYVELTTLRQRLVTKKNQKLRKLQLYYPDINVKLFYGRDVRALLSKFGIRLRANHPAP